MFLLNRLISRTPSVEMTQAELGSESWLPAGLAEQIAQAGCARQERPADLAWPVNTTAAARTTTVR